jgi:hypothetical protein
MILLIFLPTFGGKTFKLSHITTVYKIVKTLFRHLPSLHVHMYMCVPYMHCDLRLHVNFSCNERKYFVESVPNKYRSNCNFFTLVT